MAYVRGVRLWTGRRRDLIRIGQRPLNRMPGNTRVKVPLVQLTFGIMGGLAKSEQGSGQMSGSDHFGAAFRPVIGGVDRPAVVECL